MLLSLTYVYRIWSSPAFLKLFLDNCGKNDFNAFTSFSAFSLWHKAAFLILKTEHTFFSQFVQTPESFGRLWKTYGMHGDIGSPAFHQKLKKVNCKMVHKESNFTFSP